MAQLKTSALKERCDRLQKHLEIRKLVSAEELNEIKTQRPRSRDDWWERYAVLKSYARRLEFEGNRRDDSTTASPLEDNEAQRIRMLLATPMEVVLDDGKKYKVHPKSYNALCMIVAVDYAISWLVEMADELVQESSPSAPAHLPRIAEQIGRLQNIMCDIILFDGNGFDPAKLDDPTPYDFSPMDLMTLQRVHNDLNVVRMMALPVVTKKQGDKPGRATGWSEFFVIMGMKKMVDPAKLMNDESLVKLLAEANIRMAANAAAEEEVRK